MSEVSYTTPEQWAEIRARNVGSSESPALLGLTTWTTPFALYHAKRARRSFVAPENNRMDAGKRLEHAIGAWAADAWNLDLTRAQVYVQDDTVDGMGSTLDFIVTDKMNPSRGPGLLEIKNRDWLQWKQHWTDERAPADVAAQVQHQFACTGFQWGEIACLVGGNELRRYSVTPAERAMTRLRDAVADFWAAVANGLEPPVEGLPCDLETLKGLYAEVDEEKVVESEDYALAEDVRLFAWARDEANNHGKTADACKAKILQAMGDAKILNAPTVRVRRTIDKRGAHRLTVFTDLEHSPADTGNILEAG